MAESVKLLKDYDLDYIKQQYDEKKRDFRRTRAGS